MIRRFPIVFAALFAVGAFAQRGQFGSPSGFGNVNYPGTGHPPNAVGYSGFGNVNFPAMGRAPAAHPTGSISSSNYPGRLGATVGGYSSSYYGGVVRGAAHPVHGRQSVVAVPIIVGGWGYGSSYYSGYDPSTSGYYDDSNAYASQQPSAPTVVIINQSYRPETANPVMDDYSAEPPQATVRRYDTPVHPLPDPAEVEQKPAEDKATIYLIAFKDHTILPALAYWVEGDTLNYITEQGTPNRASLSLIDRDFSTQLNRERQIEFKLP